jgi:hypothetical protein
MTNVSKTLQKVTIRARLFRAAEISLQKHGWTVERVSGSGKSSLRRITKGGIRKTVSIRTTQDTWIAFPRTADDSAWATLAEVDSVVAASVDDRGNPRFAKVHLIDGDEVRSRFDRAYAARKAAQHTLPIGRGVWVSLYEKDSQYPVNRVGAGAATDENEIGRVPLEDWEPDPSFEGEDLPPQNLPPLALADAEEEPITIAQAKRRLAMSLGVSESDIKITISS